MSATLGSTRWNLANEVGGFSCFLFVVDVGLLIAIIRNNHALLCVHELIYPLLACSTLDLIHRFAESVLTVEIMFVMLRRGTYARHRNEGEEEGEGEDALAVGCFALFNGGGAIIDLSSNGSRRRLTDL